MARGEWLRVVPLVVVGASLAACGSSASSASSPTQFARLVVRWSAAGEYDKVYDNLYVPQQRAISRARYIECSRDLRRVARRAGVDLATVQIIGATPSTVKRSSVPGTRAAARVTVVHFRVSILVRGRRTALPRWGGVYVTRADRRWRFIDGLGALARTQCLAPARETLGSELLAKVPSWVEKQGFTNNQEATEGARLFAVSGCLNCHTYLGVGGGYPAAPDLTAEGSKHKGIPFQVAHLNCPSCVNPSSAMPSFAGLGTANLKKLAAFLEASKG